MKNLGELKHYLRQVIRKDDDVELALNLHHLSPTDQHSLINTTFENDSVKCFKLLKSKFYSRMQILEYTPPKICMELVDDPYLLRSIIIKCAADLRFADYFCAAFDNQNKYQLDLAIMFCDVNNLKPAYHILEKTNDEMNVRWIHMINPRPKYKPFTDKYKSFWDYLDRKSKEIIDFRRVKHEDWLELCNFPWEGFVNVPVYVLWDILKDVYINNYWLHSIKMVGNECAGVRFITAFRKKVIDYRIFKNINWQDIFNLGQNPCEIYPNNYYVNHKNSKKFIEIILKCRQ